MSLERHYRADAQVLRLAFLKNVELRRYNPLPGSRRSLMGRIFTSLHDMVAGPDDLPNVVEALNAFVLRGLGYRLEVAP